MLPSLEQLAPHLRAIDAARVYSNHGALHDQLLNGLAAHYGLEPARVVLACSGTTALIGLILALAGRAPQKGAFCLCPAHTFVATAVAARACGYELFFCDVDPDTWALDPNHLEELPQLPQASCVIVVAPYGRRPDLEGWRQFALRTGKPVIVDAAGCFDSLDIATLQPASGEGGLLALAVSLHATKTLSTAEGGLLVADDPAVAERAGRALNFGFTTQRQAVGPSINGKLSEYHAAIGLAELEGWPRKQAGFRFAATAYRELSIPLGFPERLNVNPAQANPYALFHASDPAEARGVARELSRAGIGHRFWYGRGLHRQPEFSACPAEPLPITEDLTSRLVGLPFACDLGREEIGAVLAALGSAVAHREAPTR